MNVILNTATLPILKECTLVQIGVQFNQLPSSLIRALIKELASVKAVSLNLKILTVHRNLPHLP